MEKKSLKGRLDYTAMIIPLLGVVLLCVLFMIMPAKSSYIIQMIRGFLGNDCGIYYAMLGVGIFACSLYIDFSKYGKRVLKFPNRCVIVFARDEKAVQAHAQV